MMNSVTFRELAAPEHGQPQDPESPVTSAPAVGLPALELMVELGRARTALSRTPVKDIFSALVRRVQEVTGAMAVTVSALPDSELTEALSGQAVVSPRPTSSGAAHLPRHRATPRADWPRSFVVRESVGELDLGATRATSVVNLPMEVAGVRVGTIMLLSQTRPFTALETEATRQLVEVTGARLREGQTSPPGVGAPGLSDQDWQLWQWARDGLAITSGQDHRILRATETFSRSLGLDPQEAVGSVVDWSTLEAEYQDGATVPVEELPPVKALRTGVSQPPVIVRIADRTVKGNAIAEWVQLAAQPIVDTTSGEVLQVHTWMRNVSRERRLVHRLSNANQRLESARQVSNLVWWNFDAERGLRVSELSRVQLGLPDTGPYPDVPTILSWIHPHDLADLRERFTASPAPGDDHVELSTVTIRMTPPDGIQRHLRVSARLTTGAKGQVKMASGTTFDISEEAAMRAELQVSKDLFQRAFERAPIGMALLETTNAHRGRIIRVNPELTAILGYPSDRGLVGKLPLDYVALGDVPLLRKQLLELQRGLAKTLHEEISLVSQDGTLVRCLVTGTSSGAESPYVLCHIQAMTGRETAVRATVVGERLLQVAFDHAPIGMLMVTMAPGREGRAVMVNQAMVDLVRRPLPNLLGFTPSVFMTQDESDAAMESLREVMRTRSPNKRIQQQLTRADGEVVHCWVSTMVVDEVSPGGPFVLMQFVDVTTVHGQQKALERMALTDDLTRLPNRALFATRVDQALERMFPGSRLAVMVLDLDRFKNVNDGLGHHVGDRLLIEVAARLSAIEHPGLTVARQGGDEFTVLVEGLTDDYQVMAIAEHLLAALTADYIVAESHMISTSASIGVAVADDANTTREQLLREADLALYAAKAAGRNRFVLCGAELLEAAARREDAEQRLRRGMQNEQLRVMLQPIVNLTTGRISGMEALVRVQDPEVGLLNPGEIIGVAEDAGMINELDRRVMDEAVRLVTVDPRFVDDPSTRVSINVSGRTLEQPGLVSHLATTLAKYRVPGNRIIIELTESSLLQDDPAILQAVMGLKQLGAEIGIDDFGTGYSALAYLERFDLDFLKIDRSFVSRIGDPPDRKAVATVSAIIELAHAHGLRVTAEGIETEHQAQILQDLGCDCGQGWLLGQPTSTDPTEHFLAAGGRDDLETEL